MPCNGKQTVQNARSDSERKNKDGEVQWYLRLFLAIITYIVILLTKTPKMAHSMAKLPPT